MAVPCLGGHCSIVWLVIRTQSSRETSDLGSTAAAHTSQVLLVLTPVPVEGPWLVDMVPHQPVVMLPTELALSTSCLNVMFLLLPAFSNCTSGRILQRVFVSVGPTCGTKCQKGFARDTTATVEVGTNPTARHTVCPRDEIETLQGYCKDTSLKKI